MEDREKEDKEMRTARGMGGAGEGKWRTVRERARRKDRGMWREQNAIL